MRKTNEATDQPALADVSGPAEAHAALPALLITRHPGLGACACGADTFVLANELKGSEVPGIRISRMYECANCGAYRLGK